MTVFDASAGKYGSLVTIVSPVQNPGYFQNMLFLLPLPVSGAYMAASVSGHQDSPSHCKALCSAVLLAPVTVDAYEGMTGSLVVKGVKSHQYRSFKVDGSDWPPKYWKVLLELEGNVSLAFSDARRFARVRLQVSLNCFPVPVQFDICANLDFPVFLQIMGV